MKMDSQFLLSGTYKKDIKFYNNLFRPKRAYLGRAFTCMGIFTPSLMGTEIFPLSPKQEKLYHAVATDGPINHFDGDNDESFIDDIKTYMSQVLVSRRPNNQKKPDFLVRWNNDFNEDWAQKFPHASHRIFERSSRRIELTAEEQSAATFSISPNLYGDRQVIT